MPALRVMAELILGPGRRAKEVRDAELDRLQEEADRAVATLKFEIEVLRDGRPARSSGNGK